MLQWHEAQDVGERRRIRSRIYKLRERHLREMVKNDEESLGALNISSDGEIIQSFRLFLIYQHRKIYG